MKLFHLALFASLSSVLSAVDHEVTLLVSRQYTRDSTRYLFSNLLYMEPASPTAFTARYGYDMLSQESIGVQLQLTYHAKSSAEVKSSTHSSYFFSESTATFKNEGLSAGIQAQWRYFIQFGLGTELRYEKLEMGSISTSQTRPWLTSRIAYSTPSPGVYPIFGLEYAIAFVNHKRPEPFFDPASNSWFSEPKDVLKSLSPKYELSIYAGIHF